MTNSNSNTSARNSEQHSQVDEAFLQPRMDAQMSRRKISTLEAFGLSQSFKVIGLIPFITTTLVYSLPGGGTHSIVWGWLSAFAPIILVSLSLAEIGATSPSSIGLHYWSFRYASPKTRNFLSWITGYSSVLGRIATLAGISWGGAVQIMAAASIGSEMKFIPTGKETFGVFAALIVFQSFIAGCGSHVIRILQKAVIILNIALVIAFIVSIAAATPSEFRTNHNIAFGTFTNLTSWRPGWFAFILALVYPLWTINAFDAVTSISQEASDDSLSTAMTIMVPACINGILGFGVNILLAFLLGSSIPGLVNNPLGQPMALILLNSLGKHGSLALLSFIIVGQILMGILCTTSLSQQTVILSRSLALPCSHLFTPNVSRTRTPILSIWIPTLLSLLLGLLTFISSSSTLTIFTLAIVAQYIAYSIPIASRLLFFRSNGFRLTPLSMGIFAPFSLWIFSIPASLGALACTSFLIVVFCFPMEPHLDAHSMNYTSLIVGGWLVLSLVIYYLPPFNGRRRFKGPHLNVGGGDAKVGDEKVMGSG